MSEPVPTPVTATQFAQASTTARRLREEIAHALIGQDAVVEQILIALFAAGHVLIEGVPGLGKTLLVQALAKTFNGHFARIQFTPDLMPSDITGHALFDRASESFRIRRGPIFTHLLLADEINRAPAKTQAALLEVMQERQVTIEGETLPIAAPFMALATQNTLEQEGTYPLPEAQLDRFLLKVLITYPSQDEEHHLVRKVTVGHVGDSLNVDAVATVLDADGVLQLQQIVSTLRIDERITDYAVRIARQTREWPGIAVGAGPRGAIAMVRAARAHALLNGNDYVTPDDIKAVATAALRHRLTLAPELDIEGQTPDTVLGAVLEQVDTPRT